MANEVTKRYVDYAGLAEFKRLNDTHTQTNLITITGVQLKGSKETTFVDVPFGTGDYAKKAQLDLSAYALLSDLTTVYKFKGSVDYYDTNDRPATEPEATVLPTGLTKAHNGDVYNVRHKHGNYPAGTNYAWVWNDGTSSGEWDALGGAIDLSAYWTSQETQNAINTAKDEIQGKIDYLYKENGDRGYVAATGTVPAVGAPKYYVRSGTETPYTYTLADPQPAAGTSAEGYYVKSTSGVIDARLKSLESTVGPGGSVEEQIDAKIALLDVADIGTASSTTAVGTVITVVGETDGKIHATAENKLEAVAATTTAEANRGLVTEHGIRSAISTAVADEASARTTAIQAKFDEIGSVPLTGENSIASIFA